tara:strand:- start:316 stop:762 length:447 start_codon:yes stop_codon:yes gene_type:complete
MQTNQLNDTQGVDIATNIQDMPGMDSGGFSGFIILPLILYVILLVVLLIGIWRMFEKGGIPGILGLIPVVNLFFLSKLAGKPMWWGLLYFIPFVNVIIAILILIGISERFGRGIGTALGLVFLTPLFFCILGFGSAEYSASTEPRIES